MTQTNGNGTAPTLNEQQLRRLEELIFNVSTLRQNWLRSLLDPRRNIDDECGYKVNPSISDYRDYFDKDAIAARVVEVLPAESWQVQPCLYEDDDPDSETEFEKAWAELIANIKGDDNYFQDQEGSTIWQYLRRADELCGIGTFGLILLGLDDGKPLWQPAAGAPPDGAPAADANPRLGGYLAPEAGVTGTDAQYYTGSPLAATPAQPPAPAPKGRKPKLLFLRVFDESLVQVTSYESDLRNPRYGQPVYYLITLNDPRVQHGGLGMSATTERVHWSRVVHVADNLKNSEIFGTPRMKPVMRNIQNLEKLYGGSAEMYWKGAFPGLSLETAPELGGDVVWDRQDLRDTIENYFNGLQRVLALNGFTAKTLSPTVVDPGTQIQVQIQAICIKLGIPQRVFMGSERGELASSQDDAKWNDVLRARQRDHVTPRIIAPFVNRLILLGVLPKPKELHVDWPDLDSQTDAGKAAIAVQKTQALAAYVGGNVEAIMPPLQYLTTVLGLSDDEAQAILDAAEEKQQEEEDAHAALADQIGAEPTPPPGYARPKPPTPPPGQPPQAPQEDAKDMVDAAPAANANPNDDARSILEQLAAPTANADEGGWVTLESGQHVFLTSGGIHPGGPGTPAAGRKATSHEEAKVGGHEFVKGLETAGLFKTKLGDTQGLRGLIDVQTARGTLAQHTPGLSKEHQDAIFHAAHAARALEIHPINEEHQMSAAAKEAAIPNYGIHKQNGYVVRVKDAEKVKQVATDYLHSVGYQHGTGATAAPKEASKPAETPKAAPKPAASAPAKSTPAPKPAAAPTPTTPAPASGTHGPSKAQVQTQFKAVDAAKHLLGEHATPQDIASVVGAPDDARVLAGSGRKESMSVTVTGKGYRAERNLGKDADGRTFIENVEIRIDKDQQGKGLGSQIFSRQVEHAQKMGVGYIKTEASKGTKDDPLNGYYTWARLGYDQPVSKMSAGMQAKVKQAFPKAESVLDVMSTKGGRDWWKQNGETLKEAHFDLTPGSRSLKVLAAYQQERKERK